MIEQKYYIKYPLNYPLIREIINKTKKRKVNFFIDFNSICKGFYKAETVLYEIGEYVEHGEISGKLISELKDWLNTIYNNFKNFDPFFVLFYDDGKCIQNRMLMSTYKSGRSINTISIDEDQKTTELFRKIRKYYYTAIKEKFEKPDLCSVQYLSEYETDLVPHYCIQHNIFDSNDPEVLNIILSVDKDLLQTTAYDNTIMCPTGFKNDKTLGKYVINFQVFDKKNALSYIYEKFIPGCLTAKYIPLVLSITGDKSDEIPGLTGFGPSKAIKFIENNNIPYNIDGIKLKLNMMPQLIQDNIDIIIRNLKLISFDEQIKRLPKEFLT